LGPCWECAPKKRLVGQKNSGGGRNCKEKFKPHQKPTARTVPNVIPGGKFHLVKKGKGEPEGDI